jgi:hypothetical protein
MRVVRWVDEGHRNDGRASTLPTAASVRAVPWPPFGDVKTQAGDPGFPAFVATTFLGNNLHVVITTQ